MGFTDFLHNLTKTGVYDPKSGETYYSDADKALNAFGSAVHDFADKSADFQKNIGPEFAGDSAPAEPAFLGKPTFAEATDVTNPNARRMLTKGGALMSILKGGLEGGLAGQAANAEMYARTGRSGGVGVGLGAGFEAPYQEAATRQAVQHGNLENQELQGRVNLLPWQVATQRVNLQKDQAEADRIPAQKALDEANALKAQFQVVDGVPYHITPGAAPFLPPKMEPVDGAALIPLSPELAKLANKEPGSAVPISQALKLADLATKGTTNYTTSEGVFEKNRVTGKSTRLGTAPSMFRIEHPVSDVAQQAIEVAAQSLAKGDLTPLKDIASMRGDQRLLIYTRAKQLNPNFSTAGTDRKIKMEDYYANGKGADNLRSFGTFLEHGGEASDAVNQIRLSSSPAINKPLNWWKENISGDPNLINLLGALEPVRKEFESFLLGGKAMYAEDRKAAETILSDNSSPAQIQAALKRLGYTAKARFNEENFRYKKVIGRDLQEPFSPEAIQGAQKIGVELGGSAGLYKVIDPRGVEHTFNSQEDADAFRRAARIQ